MSKEKATTIRRKKLTSKLKETKPWFDAEVYFILQMKQKYGNIKTKNLETEEDVRRMDLYKYWRNKATEIKRTKKREFNEKNFYRTNNDPAKMWKWIKNVMFDWETKREECPLLINCTSSNEKIKKLNDLNDFFCSVGEKLALNFSSRKAQQTNARDIFRFRFTTKEEIEEIISTSKNTNSEGADHISMKLMKKISPIVSQFLSNLINTSLHESSVPAEMKLGKVTPIYKNKDKQEPSNYRPICQLPLPAKIEEKLINIQLMDHLEKHQLLSKNQYGFRRKSNTDGAIFDITTEISQAIDNGKKVAVVFIDQKKAFDSAHHKTLLTKLHNIGVTGREHKWFANYLAERKQFSRVDGISSNVKLVPYGIPQGSSLSGTNYIIYNNDLNSSTKHGKHFIYADDDAILFTAPTYENLESIINEDMQLITSYFDLNKTTLNIDKTEMIIFRDANPPPMNITINNIKIKVVTSAPYLGVTLDHDMKWTTHIQNLRKKLAPIAGVFKKIKNNIPERLKRTLFLSFFQAKLLYGIEAWGCADCNKLNIIQHSQNKAIKNLLNLPRQTSTKDIHEKLNVLTIKQLHTKVAATHIFKMKENMIHHNTQLIRGIDLHDRNTKYNNQIRIPKTCSKYFGSSSIINKSITTFNALPTDLQNESSLPTFTLKLKSHISSLN